MILGDSTVGNARLGINATPVELSLTANNTSDFTVNKAANLAVLTTSNSSLRLNEKVNLSLDASIREFGESIGGGTLGSFSVGITEQTGAKTSSKFVSLKGVETSFSANSDSTLRLSQKIALSASLVSQSSSEWAVFKGVSVQFQSTSESTAVFVPDFDEIIGRTRADGTRNVVERADGERVFIIQATGNID